MLLKFYYKTNVFVKKGTVQKMSSTRDIETERYKSNAEVHLEQKICLKNSNGSTVVLVHKKEYIELNRKNWIDLGKMQIFVFLHYCEKNILRPNGFNWHSLRRLLVWMR